MGYLRTRYGRRRAARVGLGDTIGTLLSTASDPYLSETICRVSQLKALNDHTAVPGCTTTPPGMPGGIGLRKVMPAFRGYVYAEQYPWVYFAAIAGVVGLPMLIGYALGKGAS